MQFDDLLELAEVDDGHFLAPAARDGGRRTFGGQFLAQSIHAAYHSVSDDRHLHSLHAYFLRPGDDEQPSDVVVETIRDGRSFSNRCVRVLQGDTELFRTMTSFAVPAQSPAYDAQPELSVPPPEAVSYTYNDFNRDCGRELDGDWGGGQRPYDIRYINPPQAPRGEPVTVDQLMWMRITDALPDDPGVHSAGIAYLSDSTLIDHVLLPHGLRWQDADFIGASLDHALWQHRPARADNWLLFRQTVEWTGDGRGLATGRIFDESGALVATCTQEGLLRWSN